MPGPGGGSRGGGGGRGGSFGGGGRGGSFGGPRPGGHRPPPMGGWGWHRPRHYGGGGCLSNLMGLILLPIFLVVALLLTMCNGANVMINNGYDEEVFQDYADAQYRAEFGNCAAYEDNILLVILTSEDYYEYYYIAWVGDHIVTDIDWMFGGNDTELGQAMDACINASNYKYSLDSDLAQVMQQMTQKVQDLELESSYSCNEDRSDAVVSHLTNHTDMEMTHTTVEDALLAFTAQTGIPVVIVVEQMDEVFGSTSASFAGISSQGILIGILVILAIVVLAVVFIKRKNSQTNSNGSTQRNSRYSDFDDQYQ